MRPNALQLRFTKLTPLRHFEPQQFLNDNLTPTKRKERNMILTLALIYNDFHSLFVLHDTLLHEHVVPGTGKADIHTGELGGLRAYLDKILISTLREAVKYISQNEQNIKNLIRKYKTEFSITRDEEREWESAFTHTQEKPKYLKHIRDSVGFHYDDEKFSEGFSAKFRSGAEQDAASKFCFVSMPMHHSKINGSFVTSGRYYFADGAVEAFVNINPDGEDIFMTLTPLVTAVGNLVRIYIDSEIGAKPYVE